LYDRRSPVYGRAERRENKKSKTRQTEKTKAETEKGGPEFRPDGAQHKTDHLGLRFTFCFRWGLHRAFLCSQVSGIFMAPPCVGGSICGPFGDGHFSADKKAPDGQGFTIHRG
ncbi:MAG: hypothetical protein IJK97_03900, partial [Thermoguttaceae bacterium]|nr:hypothetical protein [Thermoguttaceae bacterium]